MKYTAPLLTLMSAVFLLSPSAADARIPNDFYFDEQWYLSHIGAPAAWQYSLGMETVPIAIIDSGVDLNHPDLKDNIWRNMGETANDGIDNDGNGFIDDVFGWDFVDNDNDPNPVIVGAVPTIGMNHGTISAGIASAKGDNGMGIVGMAWQVPIMALRALDSAGTGDPVDVARAVDYAVANGAKVINLSFVGPTYSSRLAASLRKAYDRGVFVVAAAGNAPEGGQAVDLDLNPRYPVCFDSDSDVNFVYGVAATTRTDHKAAFSNYGVSCVDISAPGERVVSTQVSAVGNLVFEASYGGYYSGTSVAAPLVSGLVALMFSLDRNLTPKQVMNVLTETAFDIDSLNSEYFGRLGRGRIDAARAVQKVAERQMTAPSAVSVTLTSALLPSDSNGSLVVTAPGPGRASEIRIFTEDGLFVRMFNAFPEGFAGGTSLDIGNFDGTHKTSIVVGALAGGSPQIRIFDINTRPIGGFLAYDEAFRGGVEVAAGDVNGDGVDEVVTGAGPGGGPHLRIFDKRGVPIGGFFAFEDSYRGGIDVAVGDMDRDGQAEIAVAPGVGKSEVRIYSPRGELKRSLMPFGDAYQGGMRVDMEDLDGDGGFELIIRGWPEGKTAMSAVYDGRGEYLGDGSSVPDIGMSALGGTPVGHTAARRTAWGRLKGEIPVVTLTASAARDELSFYAYEPAFFGGVQAKLVK